MSDPGPYQSRLLNLLVPQYRRLVEKGDRAIRQMQVAASWAAQVVIYPVYLLLQTTRVAFRQLGQAVKAQLPQLQASVEDSDGGDADRPINQVLLAVLPEAEGELLLTPDVVRPQSPNMSPQHGDVMIDNTPLVSPKQQEIAYRLPEATPKVDPRGLYKGQVIRGLATELTSKNLVLVTANNQELNIFTSSQQKKIQQLIIWQLAKYWRHQRQQGLSKRPLTWGKLAQSKTIILPIRLLGQVMMWEQKGTVARTIDLFGESSLAHQPRTEPAPARLEAIAHDRKLDSFIAALEGKISIIGKGPTQIERQTREITSSASQTESVTDGREREKQNIFALLGAAIAYFFGNSGGDQNLPGSASEKVEQLTRTDRRLTGAEKVLAPILGKSPKNPVSPFYLGRPDQREAQAQTGSLEVRGSSQNQAEDWVTWIDIFGAPAGRGGKLKPTPGQAAPNRLLGYQRKQAVPQAGAATASEDRTLVATTVSDPTDQQTPGDNIYIQLAPDWIETPATPSGYVKHPLENILEWLDRGILWLEDRAIGIWKWFARQ